jgi:fatty-acyl-CoA synthase
MSGRLIDVTASAYQYPLLIKHLLHSSMLHAADQEIVYRDQKRFTYRMLARPHRSFGERAQGIGRVNWTPDLGPLAKV